MLATSSEIDEISYTDNTEGRKCIFTFEYFLERDLDFKRFTLCTVDATKIRKHDHSRSPCYTLSYLHLRDSLRHSRALNYSQLAKVSRETWRSETLAKPSKRTLQRRWPKRFLRKKRGGGGRSRKCVYSLVSFSLFFSFSLLHHILVPTS